MIDPTPEHPWLSKWVCIGKALENSHSRIPAWAFLIAACCCGSVTPSCPTLWPHGLQHTRLPCPSPSPIVYSNSCPLNWWVMPFSHCRVAFSKSLEVPLSLSFPTCRTETVTPSKEGKSSKKTHLTCWEHSRRSIIGRSYFYMMDKTMSPASNSSTFLLYCFVSLFCVGGAEGGFQLIITLFNKRVCF